MAGIGKAQFSLPHIGDEIETGREHSCASLLENDGEGAIDFGEKLAWVRGHAGMVFDEAANHAGDQSRADAVSHDVADQETRGGFAEGKDAVELAADVTGRKGQTKEMQGAFLGRNIMRNGGELLGKKSDLEFACH